MAASDDGNISSDDGYPSSSDGNPPSQEENSPSHDGNSSLDNGITPSGAMYSMVSASIIRPNGTIDTETDGVAGSLYHVDPTTVSRLSEEPVPPNENDGDEAQLTFGLELVASYLFAVEKNAESEFTKISESANDCIWKIILLSEYGENMAGQYLLGVEEKPRFLHESMGAAKVKFYVEKLFPGQYKLFEWAKEPVANTREIDLTAWGYRELVDPDGIDTKDIIPGYVVKVKIGKILLERPSTWYHLAVVFQWSKERLVAEEVEIAE